MLIKGVRRRCEFKIRKEMKKKGKERLFLDLPRVVKKIENVLWEWEVGGGVCLDCECVKFVIVD